MALCAKCGQEVGNFAGLLSHTCVPRKPLARDELQRRNGDAKLKAEQERQRLMNARDLNRQALAATLRNYGPGYFEEEDKPDVEQVISLDDSATDRFGDSTRVEKRWNSETKQWDTYQLDRTGSALRAEGEAGGAKVFNPDDDLPQDPHERSEAIAREMRFPKEQIAAINGDFRGGNLTEGRMSATELTEYQRTGKMPESALKRMTPAQRLEHFKAVRNGQEEPKQEALDLELGLG